MPQNLVDNNGSFPAQTAPVAGEARTAASVVTPLQNAADRAAFLKAKLDFIDPTATGALRIRHVASIAALQAVTDLTEATAIVVDGVGLYLYAPTSTATANSPFVVTPTSVGGGAGRWIWEAYGSLDIANGIPKLDSSGRVPTARLAASEGNAKIQPAYVANGLVGIYTSSATGPFSTTSTSYVNVGSIAPAFTMEVGDRVIILGQAYGYQQDLTPAQHFTFWQVTKPDLSTASVAESGFTRKPSALNESGSIPIGTYFQASTAGLHTFRMQQKSEVASGGATVTILNMNVVALHLRP